VFESELANGQPTLGYKMSIYQSLKAHSWGNSWQRSGKIKNHDWNFKGGAQGAGEANFGRRLRHSRRKAGHAGKQKKRPRGNSFVLSLDGLIYPREKKSCRRVRENKETSRGNKIRRRFLQMFHDRECGEQRRGKPALTNRTKKTSLMPLTENREAGPDNSDITKGQKPERERNHKKTALSSSR